MLTVWLLNILLSFTPANFTGYWLSADQDAVVEITRQGDVYSGRYVAFRKDPNNPKKKAQLNTYILKGMKPDGNDLTGKVLDPDTGKDYNATLVPTGANTLELRVKVMGLTAHKEAWTRQPGPK
ncbi:DUF2147 domain-containing protein [Hymenobacter terrenus]|uniref:DUF2147 domain-containing protein n=1 Tax=Hymenobacter terrenus TaxID=1629124 RepID=UPI0006195D4E|nr:DUF2147 domain-containing protein [Hymenobacter terrenus]